MKKPYNILHVDSEKTWRGGQRQTLLLMKHLPRDEFRSFVAAPARGSLSAHAVQAGFSVQRLRMFGEWDIIAAWRIARLCRQLDIDLIHAHSAHALGVCVIAKKLYRLPVVGSRRVDFHIKKNIFSRWKYLASI